MTLWMRFRHKNRLGFGTLERDQITVHEGDMFQSAVPAGRMRDERAAITLQPVA
ncbi:MAG TPA: DUF2437 domain-containing protein [Stellaceae bacterium]|nr:DUF2437 domain-containing protein [Stellaceae bacterium]